MGSTRRSPPRDARMPPFFAEMPIAIARGEPASVSGTKMATSYLDLTAGWGVTSIGHAHPAIRRPWPNRARASSRIPIRPTHSPVRARLLTLISASCLPALTRVFFTNSGAEANDAAAEARSQGHRSPVSDRHGGQLPRAGRISTVSATGQAAHRDKFAPQMPGYRTCRSTICRPKRMPRRRCRRRDRGAHPGRGRRAYSGGRTTWEGLRACRRQRIPAHRGRGADRLLPHGSSVRHGRRRSASRLHDHGQGYRGRFPTGRVRPLRRLYRTSWRPATTAAPTVAILLPVRSLAVVGYYSTMTSRRG